VNQSGAKVDLVPPQFTQFGHAESMPRRHADRQRIAVSVPPALPGRLRQLLDLGRRQMLTRANIGIFRPPDALAVFNYCPQNVVRGCSQCTSPSADLLD
jgi:hypothetical protein